MDKSLTRSVFLTAALLLAPLISSKAVGQDAGMDRPVEVVQSSIQRLTGCVDWKGDEARISCFLPQTRASMNLLRDHADGAVETAEILALVAANPRQPAAERESLQTVTRIVQSLVPGWHQVRVWLGRAADRVASRHDGSTVSIGKLAILVRWVVTADIPGTFMVVVVTKQK